MGLDCSSPLVPGLLIVSVYVALQSPRLVESADAESQIWRNLKYGGCTVKWYMVFLQRGKGASNP